MIVASKKKEVLMIQVITQEKKSKIFLAALQPGEEIGNLQEEEVAIIEDTAEVLERRE